MAETKKSASTTNIYLGGGIGLSPSGPVSMLPPRDPLIDAISKKPSSAPFVSGGGGGGGGGSSSPSQSLAQTSPLFLKGGEGRIEGKIGLEAKPTPKKIETIPEQPRQNKEWRENYTPLQPPSGVKEKGFLFAQSEQEQIGLITARIPAYYIPAAKDTGQLFKGMEEASFVAGTSVVASNLPVSKGTAMSNYASLSSAKLQYQAYSGVNEEFQANPKSFIGQEGVTYEQSEAGEKITLTEDYFSNRFAGMDFRKAGILKAQEMYKSLPAGTRAGLLAGSFTQGTAQFGISTGEFIGNIASNLGMKQIGGTETIGESLNRKFEFSKPIKESEKISLFEGGTDFVGRTTQTKNLPSTPISVGFFESPKQYAKELITSPEFLTGAGWAGLTSALGTGGVYKNIKTMGWKAGTVESASMFSPLRIQSGVYMPSITSSSKIRTTGTIETIGENTYGRTIFGRGQGFDIVSVQRLKVSGTKFTGKGLTLTKMPFVEVRGGGGLIEFGTRDIFTKSKFKGTMGGTGSIKAKGFDSTVKYQSSLTETYTRPILDIYKTETGRVFGAKYKASGLYKVSKSGGISEQITDTMKIYAGGKRKPVYELISNKDIFGLTQTGSYWSVNPTGKYKIEPTISGREFNIDTLLGLKEFAKSGTFGKTTKPFTPTGKTDILGGQSQIIKTASINKLIPPVALSLEIPKPVYSTGAYAGLGLYERTAGGLMPMSLGLKSRTMFKEQEIETQRYKDYSLNILGTAGIQTEKPLQFNLLSMNNLRTSSFVGAGFGFAPAFNQRENQKITQTIIPREAFKYNPPTYEQQYEFIPRINTPPPIIPFGFPPLDLFEGRKGRAKGKRKLTRTPTLFAGAFNITSYKPYRSEITGLGTRPILISKRKKRASIKSRRARSSRKRSLGGFRGFNIMGRSNWI